MGTEAANAGRTYSYRCKLSRAAAGRSTRPTWPGTRRRGRRQDADGQVGGAAARGDGGLLDLEPPPPLLADFAAGPRRSPSPRRWRAWPGRPPCRQPRSRIPGAVGQHERETILLAGDGELHAAAEVVPGPDDVLDLSEQDVELDLLGESSGGLLVRSSQPARPERAPIQPPGVGGESSTGSPSSARGPASHEATVSHSWGNPLSVTSFGALTLPRPRGDRPVGPMRRRRGVLLRVVVGRNDEEVVPAVGGRRRVELQRLQPERSCSVVA